MTPRLDLRFIAGGRGQILLTTWRPPTVTRGALLLIPPFAEELNKSRRMLTLLARAAARQGWLVALPDLTGTGDSAGEFGDARVAVWRADLRAAARWCKLEGSSVRAVLALRAGALLAGDLLADVAADTQLLLWQPAQSGAEVLTQFLRFRSAAAVTGGGRAESQEALRARFAAGETVEIAGYDLHPEFEAALRPLVLAGSLPAGSRLIDWFHLSRVAADAPPAAIAAAAAGLDGDGRAVRLHVVAGDAFWFTVEITVCPALIERTLAALECSGG